VEGYISRAGGVNQRLLTVRGWRGFWGFLADRHNPQLDLLGLRETNGSLTVATTLKRANRVIKPCSLCSVSEATRRLPTPAAGVLTIPYLVSASESFAVR
jgi:hypothetical protein